jgi:hypothetical protein
MWTLGGNIICLVLYTYFDQLLEGTMNDVEKLRAFMYPLKAV